jgi:hypothetical protein
MVQLTDEIRESLAESELVFLATAAKNSTPNVVPIKAIMVRDDGTLLISDQFFNKTLHNMQENPQAAISWWGKKGGFQLKGTVTLHTDDEVFREDVAWMMGFRPGLNPKSAVDLTVTDAFHVKPGADAGKKIL